MSTEPRLDAIARLLGDRSRAGMLSALMDGRQWTGRELARAANIAPSTASVHLQRLIDGAIVSAVSHGRHKYYRIDRPDVAQLLETLMALTPPLSEARHADTRATGAALRRLRTCYDHLAGRVAVKLADSLVERGAISFSDGTGAVSHRMEPRSSQALAFRWTVRSGAAPCAGRASIGASSATTSPAAPASL